MTVCVVLAGGRSSRMGGGDKCLLPLAGKPLLAHVLDRIAPQTSSILISSNSDAADFHGFGAPVARDLLGGFQGPLAGLLTGMIWARERMGASHVLSVPCDTPFLPGDLVLRLEEAMRRSGAEIAIACDEERSHPVIGLWPVALAGRLAADLADGTRALHRWLAPFHVREVPFAAHHFHNINTRADLQLARDQPPVQNSRALHASEDFSHFAGREHAGGGRMGHGDGAAGAERRDRGGTARH